VKRYDAVIVAIPFSTLRLIDLRDAGFDARKRAAIAELAYGDHAKLVAQFDKRYWNGRGAWPGRSSGAATTDGAIQQTWDGSRGQPGGAGLLVEFGTGDPDAATGAPYATSATPSTGERAASFVGALDGVLPGASAHANGRAVSSRPRDDSFARGSYSVWLTGQYARFAGYERARQGNVHFAGEHCSVAFQGFMEGAAQEGVRAAHEILGR